MKVLILAFVLSCIYSTVYSQTCTGLNCNACVNTTGCEYCSSSGVTFCINSGSCEFAGGSVINGTCPAVCQDPPTGPHCTHPSGWKVPSQELNPIFYNICYNITTGAGLDTNTTANCSDPCTEIYANVPQACIDSLSKVSCTSACPRCDDDFSASTVANYVLCEANCEKLATDCKSYFDQYPDCPNPVSTFTNKTDPIYPYVCSSAATCSDFTDVTGNFPSDESCNTAGSQTGASNTDGSAGSNTGDGSNSGTPSNTGDGSNTGTPSDTGAASSDGGQSSAGQSSAGQSSAGQSSAGQSSAGQSSAGQSSDGGQTSETPTPAESSSDATTLIFSVFVAFVAFLF